MRRIITITLTSLLTISLLTIGLAQYPATDTVTITYVVDGDTFYGISSQRGIKIKYRPIGINTPEMPRYGRQGQPFAQEATDYMKTLIKEGDKVRVTYDVQTIDKYGRDLVYAYTMSGLLINAELVRAGWAQVTTYPPNVTHVDTFLKLQREAREEGRGVW